MAKKKYLSPVLFEQTSGGAGSVTGEGSGQGTYFDGDGGTADVISYDEWYDEIAWGGTNIDADYNGDGLIDENDYKYYIDNELWKGGN